ncbi:hypothetical protein [Actinophytocola sp.]|uniref:hypothetical protein n=1 Tax=Actinophytocola sp. TaxID=1872138 RepID=UPI002D7FD961|nr:hypothetical protein [Actinophytocola sp.]HET9140756.1 hypothetical protein [Actinophytocola sp.]
MFDTMAQAAHAIAPPCVPRADLPKDVGQLLGFADLYVREHPGQRVVWISDISRWLESKDSSFLKLGIDWQNAVSTIPTLPIPALTMTISKRAHSLLTDSSRHGLTVRYPDAPAERLTNKERHAIHEAFAHQLTSDWPTYIRARTGSAPVTGS